jgi:hypothetical protein
VGALRQRGSVAVTGGGLVRWVDPMRLKLAARWLPHSPPTSTHRFEGEEHEEREGAGPGGDDHEPQQLHTQLAPAAAVKHAPVVGVAVSLDGGGLQASRGRGQEVQVQVFV